MNAWIQRIFNAGQVNKGNIVRRSMHSVAANGSAKTLKERGARRGFHMAVIGEQYVIVCDPDGAIKVVC